MKEKQIRLEFNLPDGSRQSITINESELIGALYLFSNAGVAVKQHFIIYPKPKI